MALIEFERASIINYGISFTVGFVLYLVAWIAVLTELAPDVPSHLVSHACLAQGIGFVFGTKLLRLFYDRRDVMKAPVEQLKKNGNSFWGGVGGQVAGLTLTFGVTAPTAWAAMDAMFLCLPVFQVFIRLGCASYGCCYGDAFDGTFAWRYTDPRSPAHRRWGARPIHPTQMYSVLKNVALLAMDAIVFAKLRTPGAGAALWFTNYSVLRFFVDFTRAPKLGVVGRYLRNSQRVAVVLFFGGLAMLAATSNTPYGRSLGTRNVALELQSAGLSILLTAALFFAAFAISFTVRRSNADPTTRAADASAASLPRK